MVENFSSEVQVPKAYPPAVAPDIINKLSEKNQSPNLLTLENSVQLDSTRTGEVAPMLPHPIAQQDWEPRAAVVSNRGKAKLSL